VKKLILLALVAVGVGVLVKNKSDQLRAGAAKVTGDPRVQSALATASERTAPLKEKAAPYAETVWDKAAPVADTVREKLHHPKAGDLAPEPTGLEGGEPLTDRLPGEEPAED
jgi:hypothetical protein